MSSRYQAGIVLPGYNALKVANAPTIGTATAGDTQVSVTFTAPACIGGGAISGYTVFANCGIKTASGASSPLVVTGLTNGTAYTFKAIATNVYGPSYPSAASNSVTPAIVQGQQAYITAGTYSWVAPAGVTSVSVVTVGGGGGAGGGNCNNFYGAGGGALAYANNISVTPGSSYSAVVGIAGTNVLYSTANNGGNSTFNSTSVGAQGGRASGSGTSGVGGTVLNGTGFAGGRGGNSSGGGCGQAQGAGGGAGGYSAIGGRGGDSGSCGVSSTGGGGGGGKQIGGGGGVGILGAGCNGAGATVNQRQGCGGSGGCGGASSTSGAAYGGGSGYAASCTGKGGVGAVRIIWPGTTRSFPSTNTGNL